MTPAQKKLKLGNRTKKASMLDKQKRESVERSLLALPKKKRESVERSLLALPVEPIDPLTNTVE
jgi:hypothetical protein